MKNRKLENLLLLVLSLNLIGCASTTEVKDGGTPINSMTATLSDHSLEKPYSPSQKENIANLVGKGFSGYIPPEISEQRKAFEKEFPIQKPDQSEANTLKSHNHNMRVGQALALGSDFDSRTAGALKDNYNQPKSVTGRVTYRTNDALSKGALAGMTTGAAMGVVAIGSINNTVGDVGLELTSYGETVVIIDQMIEGLVTGLIAGGIHASMANEATLKIIQAKTFGERVDATTLVAAHVMGFGALPIGPNGIANTRMPAINITDGVIKRVLVSGRAESNGSTRWVFITAVGSYRGDEYKKVHPYSSGWEYRITNLNEIYLPFGSISQWNGQVSLDVLRKAIDDAGIKL
jgi:hypothetical protein